MSQAINEMMKEIRFFFLTLFIKIKTRTLAPIFSCQIESGHELLQHPAQRVNFCHFFQQVIGGFLVLVHSFLPYDSLSAIKARAYGRSNCMQIAKAFAEAFRVNRADNELFTFSTLYIYIYKFIYIYVSTNVLVLLLRTNCGVERTVSRLSVELT